MLLNSLLKYIHLLTVIAAVGSMFVHYLVHLKRKNGDAAADDMALYIATKIEFRALLLAFLTGLVIVFHKTAWFHGGFLHAKITLVLLLFGPAHMIAAREKKIAAGEGERAEHLGKIQTFFMIEFALVLAIIYLIIFKPF